MTHPCLYLVNGGHGSGWFHGAGDQAGPVPCSRGDTQGHTWTPPVLTALSVLVLCSAWKASEVQRKGSRKDIHPLPVLCCCECDQEWQGWLSCVQERGWGICLCSGRGVGLSLLWAGARAGHMARGTDRMQKPWVCVCFYPSWCKKGHHTSLSLPAGQQRKCQR